MNPGNVTPDADRKKAFVGTRFTAITPGEGGENSSLLGKRPAEDHVGENSGSKRQKTNKSSSQT